MLHLTVLALAASIAAAPAASPAPSTTAAMPSVTRTTTEMTGTTHAAAPKKPNLELPGWTRYLTIEQQNAAMRAELDAEFNIDHSP